MSFLGSIIGAGASLLGGLFGNKSAKQQQTESLDRQAEFNAQQMALQKEFAQSGIRWKVDDAKAAGVHPLYALGAQTQSYTPMVLQDIQRQDHMGPALASMGQNLAGAFQAQQTPTEKAIQTLQMSKLAAEIANEQAHTDLLTSQAARLRQEQNAQPGLPDNLPAMSAGPQGLGQTNRARIVPAEVTSARKENLGLTAGPNSPSATVYQLPGSKNKLVAPAGSQLSEVWENIINYPSIIRDSAAASGISSADWLWEYITGKPVRQEYRQMPGPRKKLFRKGSGFSK